MRVGGVALFLAAIGAFSTTAAAAPSTDLVFCSKMPDKAERIACYDAAARIAEAKPRSKHQVIARPAAVATQPIYDVYASTAPALIATQQRTFHGAYAALGGSYGLSSARSANSSFSSTPGTLTVAGFGDVYPSGPSAVAALGYNFAFDRWLIGFEVDGRWGSEQTRVTSGSICCFGSPLTGTFAYRYSNDAAVHVAGRIGAMFHSTLIFAKLGLGGAHIVENYSYSDPARAAAISKSIWVPSGIFGIGIEQNFGRAFARVSAEIEAINAARLSVSSSTLNGSSSSDGAAWTARGSGMVGVRF